MKTKKILISLAPLLSISTTIIAVSCETKLETKLNKTELDNKAKSLLLIVRDAEDTKVTDLKKEDIRSPDIDTKKFEINIKKIKILKDNMSVKVFFTLKEVGGTIESSEIEKIVTGFRNPGSYILNSIDYGEPFERPYNVFVNSKPVANKNYDVSIGSQNYVFYYIMDNSNSYRIPSLIKLNNGTVLVSADKRWNGPKDYGNGKIDQVLRRSTDNGLTWKWANDYTLFTKAEEIARIETPKTGDGLTIDGVFNEVLVDRNDPDKGYKLLYLFNIFPGYEGIPMLKRGVPYIKVGNESLWKIWLKNSDGKYEDTQYVLRKVPTNPGWWRLWQLPDGKKRDTLVEADLPTLIPLKTYVDTTYHSYGFITGQVYENVEVNAEVNELLDPGGLLGGRITRYSIFDDNRKKDSKYVVAVNNHNALLESYDDGRTWQNLNLIDSDWRNDESDKSPFIGNGVGGGIQLKHQKDKSLNGRIIFPLYSVDGRIQKATYIYSDDNGKTWQRMKDLKFSSQLSESTMLEANDGTLWWFFRNPTNGGHSVISKSIDGGKTWMDPTGETTSTSHEIKNSTWNANVYTGFTIFNIKGVDYFLFTAPNSRTSRTNGAMFITKDWKTFDKVWEFDPDKNHQFGYSYPLTVKVSDDHADIVVAFEWNPEAPYTEITADKFRVFVK